MSNTQICYTLSGFMVTVTVFVKCVQSINNAFFMSIKLRLH